MQYQEILPVDYLLGRVAESVTLQEHGCGITFVIEDGEVFFLDHIQDCCESVDISDINGDLSDLVGSPFTLAEESSGEIPESESIDWYDSGTWTFFRFATVKGYVDVRFNGYSNGYYSESADFYRWKDYSA